MTKLLKHTKNKTLLKKKETAGRPGLVQYLPHHAVIKNKRDTTKTRIVFDASSKIENNLFLSDCLHSGLCVLSLIFDILLRFRIGDVAFVAEKCS